MTCCLCLRDLPLRRSHIIPEFMYEAIYDDKHRFRMFTIDGRARPEIEQKGIREELLCEECEGRIGVWERYVAHLWQGVDHVQHRRDGRLITLTGVDYALLKLFQMSVLWRAGVSKNPFFERVDLGPFEERLRARLHAQDPGDASTFGCVMSALAHNDKPVFEMIVQPTKIHFEQLLSYRFVFGGMVWVHVVASHRPPPTVRALFAQPDGTVRILVGELHEANFLKESLLELARNNPRI